MNTRTCLKCEGSGDKDGKGICGACGGRGYVPCSDQPSAPTANPPTEQATKGEHVPQDLRDVLIQAMRDCAIHSLYQHKIDHILKAIAPFCRAPAPAVAEGETPRSLVLSVELSEQDQDAISKLIMDYERELNEAKTLYAAALDTLKDMSAQVAQLTGAQDRMDAEIAMLTADLFRATSERDQARQDLEERCAENDRERAAHLQAYQAVTRERDEARSTNRARDNIGMSREEYHKAKKALEENETLRVHLASERQAKIERGDMFIELQAQYAAAQEWQNGVWGALRVALPDYDEIKEPAHEAIARLANYLDTSQKESLCFRKEISALWSRVASAEKARDEARATIESDRMAAQEHKDKLRVQRDAAESELAELRKDRERLDWLADKLCYAMVCLNGHTQESLRNNGKGWQNGELRAAVDAARNQQEGRG